MWFRNSSKEDEEEFKEASNKIKLIFVVLFLFIIVIIILADSSTYIQDKEYEEIHQQEYRTIIISKLEEASVNNDKKRKEVLLENHLQINISPEYYNRLTIGDSIIKLSGDDNRYYIKQNGESWREDLGAFLRSKLNDDSIYK
ncbi:hypothetical protein HX017_13060 [Myroides marinus]|uniref:Uncharacterized protein n=1 Tax=Myroides marinus TaxID=703342 RepID=A0A163X622_9FLAO|nr:hypothetical protein [Myroides marinus]KZE77361.1 hypothetical protein AV926_01120 [Myroides marinus]MDM1347025.1 hypothetical protein [Myroides marinus]MDM1351564.1 hypothetical protein [Myroides marinus]MDM1358794.1 hypothetical protein [Myroides marinus]MDM1362427.1 hypothetical protein [Myroides marinus]